MAWTNVMQWIRRGRSRVLDYRHNYRDKWPYVTVESKSTLVEAIEMRRVRSG